MIINLKDTQLDRLTIVLQDLIYQDLDTTGELERLLQDLEAYGLIKDEYELEKV